MKQLQNIDVSPIFRIPKEMSHEAAKEMLTDVVLKTRLQVAGLFAKPFYAGPESQSPSAENSLKKS